MDKKSRENQETVSEKCVRARGMIVEAERLLRKNFDLEPEDIDEISDLFNKGWRNHARHCVYCRDWWSKKAERLRSRK